MKFLIAFAAVIAACLAAPLDDSKNAQIVRYENDNIGLGGYNFAYETSDGQSRQEQAELKQINNGEEIVPALVMRGSYSFVGDDGQTYTVTYIADENGFQPSAPHIPVA